MALSNKQLFTLITYLKKWKNKGEVSLDELSKLAGTLPDQQLASFLENLIAAAGDEEALKSLLLDLFKKDLDQDDSDFVDLLSVYIAD